MKKMFLMLLAGLAVSATMYAQPGNFQRRTVEERVAMVHSKLDSAFGKGITKWADVDSAFANYYRAQDAKRTEMMAGGTRPDRETMMAEMKKLSDARDEKLKTILTDAQYTSWKEQIEPSMRPQRGPGGGGGGN